jgi:hypothetical protein
MTTGISADVPGTEARFMPDMIGSDVPIMGDRSG